MLADPRVIAPASVRRQLLVGVLTLAGLYAVVFAPGVIVSARAAIGDGSPISPSPGWQDRVALLEGQIFAVAVVAVVVLRWLPRHAPDLTRRMGLGRGLARAVPGGMLGAAAAYVAIAMSSGWVGDHVVATWHLASGSYPDAGTGPAGLLIGATAGLTAAVTEEITLVALVVALVEHGCRVLGRRPWWVVPATIGLMVALRWAVHLYYLWGSLFVLVWVPGVYVLYRWVGSVWPLVLGHAAYDLVLATEHAYPGLTAWLDRALWLVASLGALAVAVSLYRHPVGSGRSRSS